MIVSYKISYTTYPTCLIFQKFVNKRIRTIAYVVGSGPIDILSYSTLEHFVDLLHKPVDIERAEFKPIYEEYFVRYHERREKEVSNAIYRLFNLFGYTQTRYDVKINGNPIIDIQRAKLWINGVEIHLKTYRPKKYHSPARYLWDHPKLESVVYFTRCDDSITIDEARQAAKDLIASIIEFLDLEKDLLPAGFNWSQSYGVVRQEIVESLTRMYITSINEIIDSLDKDLLRGKGRALKILSFLATNGPSTSYEIAKEVGITVQGVHYYLSFFKKKGMISSFRRKNQVYYQLNALKGGDRVEK